MAPEISPLVHWVSRILEVAGIAIIVLGALAAVIAAIVMYARVPDFTTAYHALRTQLGRAILLGLEFLVAADIIGTVVVEPTFRSIGVLAGIVVIRTFLSFSLEVEINGRWPWQARQKGDRQQGDLVPKHNPATD
jgi:uncharacterized membrane protein